ncbi:MAG: sugar dehydrogenase complex small subunit [Gammaproteobacteria bacterium]|nr:sugar dehydrogenase complex small subunit [Gammaproteobacteria bacterium]
MRATRRSFICGVWALPALGIGGWAGAYEALERFRALSARLTGFPAASLDPALAGELLDALRATGEGAGLDDLPDGTADAALGSLAEQIIAAWYSGIHPTANGPAARAYREALVWQALEFAHAPGYCSTELNDWNRPPAGADADAAP